MAAVCLVGGELTGDASDSGPTAWVHSSMAVGLQLELLCEEGPRFVAFSSSPHI